MGAIDARRPWWKKKRWAVAAAAWLVVGWPAGAGPVAYAVGRGWLPQGAKLVYRPIDAALQPVPALWQPFARYVFLCYAEGLAAASD